MHKSKKSKLDGEDFSDAYSDIGQASGDDQDIMHDTFSIQPQVKTALEDTKVCAESSFLPQQIILDSDHASNAALVPQLMAEDSGRSPSNIAHSPRSPRQGNKKQKKANKRKTFGLF